MQMERDGKPFGSEFDYSWVDSAITNVVSYYQSAERWLYLLFFGDVSYIIPLANEIIDCIMQLAGSVMYQR